MAGSGSSPLSAALPDETYNDMPQEAQEALDELGEWDITAECRADYARRMSHYSTYLLTNGMEGLLPEDSDVELPGKCRAHYRGSKTKYWPNRIDYHKVSFQNFRAYCAQARKTVKGGTHDEAFLVHPFDHVGSVPTQQWYTQASVPTERPLQKRLLGGFGSPYTPHQSTTRPPPTATPLH